MDKNSVSAKLKSLGYVVSVKGDVVLFTNTRNGQTYALSFRYDDVNATYRHAGFSVYVGKIHSIVNKVSCIISGESNSVYIPRV